MVPHKKLVKDLMNAPYGLLISKEELVAGTQDMGTAFGPLASAFAVSSVLMRRYMPEEQHPAKSIKNAHRFFNNGSLRSLQVAGALTLFSIAATLGVNAANAVNTSRDDSTFSNNFPKLRS